MDETLRRLCAQTRPATCGTTLTITPSLRSSPRQTPEPPSLGRRPAQLGFQTTRLSSPYTHLPTMGSAVSVITGIGMGASDESACSATRRSAVYRSARD